MTFSVASNLSYLLATGQQKAGGGVFHFCLPGHRRLAHGHADYRRHVRLRAEHEQRDAERLADLAETPASKRAVHITTRTTSPAGGNDPKHANTLQL